MELCMKQPGILMAQRYSSVRNYPPGLIKPFFSASSIMFLPMRSFTLRQGSMISSLQAILAPAPLLMLFR